LEAVGVEGPESKNTFWWDGSQEQMSQNGPYLSQKGPKSGTLHVPDWRYPLTGNRSLRGIPMSRRSFSLIVAASLVMSALTTACGRSDVATGPSDIPQAMLENQGSNNLENQGSNN
jgi:hypothetical protein